MSHSSHIPYHDRRKHFAVLVGGVSVGVAVGVIDVGRLGGDVMVCSCEVVVPLISVDVLSLQPQKRPGVKHVVLVVDVSVVLTGVVEVVVVVVVLSLQPNQPLCCHQHKTSSALEVDITYGVKHVLVEVVVTSVDV